MKVIITLLTLSKDKGGTIDPKFRADMKPPSKVLKPMISFI
jgi:hypothetical protein